MSGRVWYTSDLHFGHLKLAEYRGFKSADEHDAQLILNWNELVKGDDIVWVLGDVSLHPRHLSKVELLNGRKHLIIGNHDACFPGNRDAYRYQQEYLGWFDSAQAFARRKVDGTEFLLSHFPYAGDHTGHQRYTQYRLRDEGLPLVHGHTHSSFPCDPATHYRQVHVGLDAWELRPVSQEDVVDLIRALDKLGAGRW